MSKLISDQVQILNFFKEAKDEQSAFFFWQKVDEQKIKLSEVRLKNISKINSLLTFTDIGEVDFSFRPMQVIYFFHPNSHLVFRTGLLRNEFPQYKVNLPYSLRTDEHDEEFFQKLLQLKKSSQIKKSISAEEGRHLTLLQQEYWSEEEEAIFAHLRESPRGQAQKALKVRILKHSSNNSDAQIFTLFDLSQGGLSFITDDPGLFQEKELVQIISIGDKPMGLLPCIIRSVRPMKEKDQSVMHYKVGVQFLPPEA